VKILEALLLECARLRGRIVVKDRSALRVALLKAYREPLFQIDCGEQDHGVHFKKFAISASPSF